ncbi:MAG: Rieske 2Fe-2S domain-containing protein [Xanthobacteraceae bacterium]
MTDNAGSLNSVSSWMRHRVGDLAGSADMNEQVLRAIYDGVSQIKSPSAAAHLREHGVQKIHEVIDSTEVGRLRDFVLDRLRWRLLQLATNVGTQVLRFKDEFYVDDYLILRINFPYEIARKADPAAENPGIGRLSPSVRELARSRRITDPVFDPKSYHRGHPPAAWAHGPHLDSWAGHSRDGRNIWWAICDVPAEAGMVLYPELAGVPLPVEPRTLYLKSGYPLPKPTYLPLQAGEMLVFDPEVLHGTHLNCTNGTRVAVSMRLNASKPTFDPSCFYAREFWRRSSDILAGRDKVLHLRREDNLGPAAAQTSVETPPRGPVVQGRFDAASGWLTAKLEFPDAPKIDIDGGPYRVLVVRTKDGMKAYDARCPHYGLDLSDGGCDAETLYCPACAVGFDLCSGQSAAPSLTLRSLAIRAGDGQIEIEVPA